ncbi:hypothetical protein Ocin01_09289 [Orchesella cincta]|uniref:Uncharacterized protein n=1 Tax=Orchesella cincta TaxID=48709 RepID=A0A1D2MXG1_ORCCI|nr:hypothetical protein Ocin01_09289 [Orchesella cincta]
MNGRPKSEAEQQSSSALSPTGNQNILSNVSSELLNMERNAQLSAEIDTERNNKPRPPLAVCFKTQRKTMIAKRASEMSGMNNVGRNDALSGVAQPQVVLEGERVTATTTSTSQLVSEVQYRQNSGRGSGRRTRYSYEFPATSPLHSMHDVTTFEVNLRRQTWGFDHLDSFPVTVPVRRMFEAGELPSPSMALTRDVRPSRLAAMCSAMTSGNSDINNNGIGGNTKRKIMGSYPDDDMEDDDDSDDEGKAKKRVCKEGNIGDTPKFMSGFFHFGNGNAFTRFDIPLPGRAMSWILGRQVIPFPSQAASDDYSDEMEVQSGEDGLQYLFDQSDEHNNI